MSAEPSRPGALLAILTALAVCASTWTAAAMDAPTQEALLKLEAVLEMAEFSEDLWPSWDISRTPFALHGEQSSPVKQSSTSTWLLLPFSLLLVLFSTLEEK